MFAKGELVRVGGVEPPSPVWKTGVMAAIQHPLTEVIIPLRGVILLTAIFSFGTNERGRSKRLFLTRQSQLPVS